MYCTGTVRSAVIIIGLAYVPPTSNDSLVGGLLSRYGMHDICRTYVVHTLYICCTYANAELCTSCTARHNDCIAADDWSLLLSCTVLFVPKDSPAPFHSDKLSTSLRIPFDQELSVHIGGRALLTVWCDAGGPRHHGHDIAWFGASGRRVWLSRV